MDRNTLVVEPRGGLGNRITVLHSAVELAQDLHASKIRIIWINNDECGCRFAELFERIDYDFEVIELYMNYDRYQTLLKQLRYTKVIEKTLADLKYRYYTFSLRNKALDTSRNVITPTEREQYIKPLKKGIWYTKTHRDFYGVYSCDGVYFNQSIIKRAEQVRADYPGYIAFHIRRSDNELSIQLSPTSLFEERIESLVGDSSNVKIYLATDDADLYQKLKRKYPDNIIPRQVSLERNSSSGMQDALLELLICANANKLYGSANSSFSNIAHLYGKNEFEVVRK